MIMRAKSKAEIEQLVSDITERPHVLLIALERDPDLINRALELSPVIRKKVIARMNVPKGRGRPQPHNEILRTLVTSIDAQLRANGSRKAWVRHREIAEKIAIMEMSAYWGEVTDRQVRQILDPT